MINHDKLAWDFLVALENTPEKDGKPFTYENSMEKYNCIRNGDEQGVRQAVEEFRLSCQESWVNRLSLDPLINSKYLFCMWCTLASRAAVESGVDMDVSMALLLVFVRMMDQCSSLDRICEVFEALFLEYIKQVRQASDANLSKIIVKAQQYINLHIYEKFSVQDVAQFCGCSSRQLNRLFQHSLQLTVLNYITNQKLVRARQYLSYTDQSISEVSALLGFSSQSYFTMLFRNAFGITPRKYCKSRKKLLCKPV